MFNRNKNINILDQGGIFMLDDFQNSQPIVYRILKKAIEKDECSHAYLFETNGYPNYQEFILAFVKALVCPDHHMNNQKECKYCNLVDSGNFPELKVINPDGFWIKKSQLQSLQDEFNKKPIMGNKKVYIINGADKLNKQSANSILKFLEEPDNNIVAILVTDNIYQVLTTIRSRCQIISFKNTKLTFDSSIKCEEKIEKLVYQINEEENKEKILKIIDFVNYYEAHHIDTLLYLSTLWHQYIKTKDETEKSFEVILLYYKDILASKLNRNIYIFNDKINDMHKIAEKNTIEEICNKINIIMELKQNIKYNANLNLLMDKLIITLEGRN